MSVSKQGIEITNRFYHAVDVLISNGRLRNLSHFTELYGLNYGNTHTQRKKPELYILKPELIASICRDFGISTKWVLLGTGNMFERRSSVKSEIIT